MNIVKMAFNHWLHDIKKNKLSQLFVVVLLAAIVGGIWKGFSWYRLQQIGKEQIDFMQIFTDYDTVLQLSLKPGQEDIILGKWQDVELSLKTFIDKNPSSFLIPFAYVFQSDAQVNQNNIIQAIDTLSKSLDTLPKKSISYAMLQIKHALLKIDSGDIALSDVGVADLYSFAHDNKNSNADTAAFYLGYYYWCKKDYTAAKDAWSIIVDSLEVDPKKASSWYPVVIEKMRQIS